MTPISFAVASLILDFVDTIGNLCIHYYYLIARIKNTSREDPSHDPEKGGNPRIEALNMKRPEYVTTTKSELDIAIPVLTKRATTVLIMLVVLVVFLT